MTRDECAGRGLAAPRRARQARDGGAPRHDMAAKARVDYDRAVCRGGPNPGRVDSERNGRARANLALGRLEQGTCVRMRQCGLVILSSTAALG